MTEIPQKKVYTIISKIPIAEWGADTITQLGKPLCSKGSFDDLRASFLPPYLSGTSTGYERMAEVASSQAEQYRVMARKAEEEAELYQKMAKASRRRESETMDSRFSAGIRDSLDFALMSKKQEFFIKHTEILDLKPKPKSQYVDKFGNYHSDMTAMDRENERWHRKYFPRKGEVPRFKPLD